MSLLRCWAGDSSGDSGSDFGSDSGSDFSSDSGSDSGSVVRSVRDCGSKRSCSVCVESEVKGTGRGERHKEP